MSELGLLIRIKIRYYRALRWSFIFLSFLFSTNRTLLTEHGREEDARVRGISKIINLYFEPGGAKIKTPG